MFRLSKRYTSIKLQSKLQQSPPELNVESLKREIMLFFLFSADCFSDSESIMNKWNKITAIALSLRHRFFAQRR